MLTFLRGLWSLWADRPTILCAFCRARMRGPKRVGSDPRVEATGFCRPCFRRETAGLEL